MARISGVDLPREKRVEIGLTYIYGIGRSTAQNILRETGVNPDIRVKDLSESDVNKLREYIDHHCKVEGDLRREVSMNIKRLIEVGCYRGVRHRKGLPVRGQSTKQNARTRKGEVKTLSINHFNKSSAVSQIQGISIWIVVSGGDRYFAIFTSLILNNAICSGT